MKHLIETLNKGHYTLVVANNDKIYTFTRRGVIDLAETLKNSAETLCGAMVADKVVGKAAAALMIEGGIKRLHTHVISVGAVELFDKTSISFEYDLVVPFIENRDKTGRCPVDTICANLESTSEIKSAVFSFLNITKP